MTAQTIRVAIDRCDHSNSINLPPHRDQLLGVLHVELLGGFLDCCISIDGLDGADLLGLGGPPEGLVGLKEHVVEVPLPALPEGGLDLDGISLLGGRGNNLGVTGERLLGLTGFPAGRRR
jgi:hypothetical protein